MPKDAAVNGLSRQRFKRDIKEAGRTTMTRTQRPPMRQRLLVGLCRFVALEFLLFAPLKFLPGGAFGYPPYAERFVDWGYPAWFALVVGGAEIFAAVMLILPRRRFLGAAVLIVILIGAVTTHIVNHHSLATSISAPVHLLFAVIIALTHWPTDWREPLTRGEQLRESVLTS